MRGRCAAGFCRVPGRRGGGVRQRREHRRDGGRHPGHNAVADGPGAHRDAHTARPPTLGTTGAPALLGESVTTPAGPKLVLVNTSSRPVTLSPSRLFPAGFTAAQTTAPSVMTLVTGPRSTTTTTSHGTGQLQLGAYTLATVSG